MRVVQHAIHGWVMFGCVTVGSHPRRRHDEREYEPGDQCPQRKSDGIRPQRGDERERKQTEQDDQGSPMPLHPVVFSNARAKRDGAFGHGLWSEHAPRQAG